MIRIGIEVSRRNLQCDLLQHPGRYFFILAADDRASLCIRTCNSEGEDINDHVIEGLVLKEDGYLHSVFEEAINDAIMELQEWKRRSCLGSEYPISFHLACLLSQMPDLVDWIISSFLSYDRNLVFFQFADD